MTESEATKRAKPNRRRQETILVIKNTHCNRQWPAQLERITDTSVCLPPVFNTTLPSTQCSHH